MRTEMLARHPPVPGLQRRAAEASRPRRERPRPSARANPRRALKSCSRDENPACVAATDRRRSACAARCIRDYGAKMTSEPHPVLADSFEMMVFWMNDEPMLPGRTYLLRAGASTVTATIAPLKYRLSLASLEHVAANQLEHHDVGVCAVELGEPIVFDPYVESKQTRGVVFLDPVTKEAIGAGLIRFALAPVSECSLARPRHRQSGACGPQTAASLRHLANWPFRRWQVDDRQSCRAQAPRPWFPHLPTRRRQCSARPANSGIQRASTRRRAAATWRTSRASTHRTSSPAAAVAR